MVEDDLSSWSGLLIPEITPTLAGPENSSVIALAQGESKRERSVRGRCVHLPGVSVPLLSVQSLSLLGFELKREGGEG